MFLYMIHRDLSHLNSLPLIISISFLSILLSVSHNTYSF